MQFNIDNHTSYEPDLNFLGKIVQDLTSDEVELIISYSEYIKDINKEFRNKEATTDVLSFPYDPMPFTPLGSIVINMDLVQAKADHFGHSVDDEFALLFIHGLLHLLGYDHEVDDGEHRNEEEKLIKKYNLPQSLIIRNQ